MKTKITSFFALLLAIAVLSVTCVFAASAAAEDTDDASLDVHITSNLFESSDVKIENTSNKLRVTFEFYLTMNIEQIDFRMNYDSTVLSPASDENSAELSCPNLSGIIFNPICKPSDEYADNADMLSVAAAATDFRNLMDFSSEKKLLVTVLFDIIDPSADETAIDLVVRDLYLKEAGSAPEDAATRVIYLSNVNSSLVESTVISAVSSGEEVVTETSSTTASATEETTASETEETTASETEETTTSATEETTAYVTEETTASATEETTAYVTEEATASAAEETTAETQPTSEPASTTATEATTAPSNPEYTYGDVNRDGRVDITDATEIQKYVAQISGLDDEQKLIADVSGSGTVDITDVILVQKFTARIITAFPIQIG